MSELNKSAIKRIKTCLEETYFTSASFDLKISGDDSSNLIDIYFIDNPEFCFSISDSPESYKIYYSPGSITKDNQAILDNFEKCLIKINSWSNNIKQELINSHPLFDEFEELKKTLNHKIESNFSEANVFFTKEEVSKVKTSLDEIQEKLTRLEEESEINKGEIYNLKKTIQKLRNDSEKLPKKTWYRVLGNTFLKFAPKFAKSETCQKLLEQGATKLIDSIK